MKILKYLKEQLLLHPSMEPQDVIKLCYQAAFGAEHMTKYMQMARDYLHQEYEELEEGAEDEPLFECISEISCRVNLRTWKRRNIPIDWLFSMFIESGIPLANSRFLRGEEKRELFKGFVEEAEVLVKQGSFSFDIDKWNDFLDKYSVEEPVAVHHSDNYRKEEKPAYRLVSRHYVKLMPLLETLAKLPQNQVQIVAVDGRSGSGKTILAKELAALLGAGVIHMDDFFLPVELRTKERLAEAGGNIHYERFVEEVLPGLKHPDPFTYGRFDCKKMALVGERRVENGMLRIVEGCYSCHPKLGDYMSVRVFCNVDEKVQLERIAGRDGEEALEAFEQRWIPLEENYFRTYNIKEKADVMIES